MCSSAMAPARFKSKNTCADPSATPRSAAAVPFRLFSGGVNTVEKDYPAVRYLGQAGPFLHPKAGCCSSPRLSQTRQNFCLLHGDRMPPIPARQSACRPSQTSTWSSIGQFLHALAAMSSAAWRPEFTAYWRMIPVYAGNVSRSVSVIFLISVGLSLTTRVFSWFKKTVSVVTTRR